MPNLTELVYKEGKINGKGKVMKRSIVKVVLSTALLTSVGFGSELVLGSAQVEFEKKLSQIQIRSLSVESKDILTVISTDDSLSQEDIDKIYNLGAKSVLFAGKNSYYLLATEEKIETILDSFDSINGIAVVKPEHKIDKELQNVDINALVRVKVSLVEPTMYDSFKQMLDSSDIEYKDLKLRDAQYMAELSLYGIDIKRLASIPLIKQVSKYHEIGLVKPFSKSISPDDISVIDKVQVDDVWAISDDLDGMNIPIAMVDEGRVKRTHVEFQSGQVSRVKVRVSDGRESLHSTHVAGIIGAKGVNTNAKGIANGSLIYNFSYNDEYFSDSISSLASRYGILLSNHSYGFTDKSDLGEYNSDAASEDRVVYDNPYINMFVAAGNDKGSDGYPDVMIIKGAANAKNVFTVGALDYSSSKAAYYSSTGPVFDGRIKPDFAVKGSSVYSTSNSKDNGYAYMTGTSMATPSATAIAALVMQEYKKVTNCGGNIGCDMRHDVLKAVLINTAIDKNQPGPDIYTGFGMLDAKDAIETVKSLEYSHTKHKIKLDIAGRGSIKEYRFSTGTKGDFSVTLSWVDPAGNSANRGRTLVNDMDMYLVDLNSGKKYYPYSLDRSDPTALAVNDRPNSVDVVEKIEVKNLPAGEYKLVVSADNISTSSQRYAIAASESIFDKSSVNNTPKVKLELNNFAKVMLDSIY